MVGAVHTIEKHDELTPVMRDDFYVTNQINNTTNTRSTSSRTYSSNGGGY